jgi:hypothetical protein
MTWVPDFVPALRADLLRCDLGLEAVLWSPARANPVALDPVATVMLGVIDGAAAVADLVADVREVVGLPEDIARSQVWRVLNDLDRGGLLASSVPAPAILPRSLFANPVSSCMESASCTGRVEEVNLEVGGREIRIACHSSSVARRIRRALQEHLIAHRAPLGFMLRSSRRHPRRLVLVDRSGLVIGTASGGRQALAMLGSHLSALLPVPDGGVRLRVRALVQEGRATLCQWPLLFVPPLDEPSVAAAGYAVVDRLAVDLDVATGAMVNLSGPWPSAGATSTAAGHVVATAEPIPVDRLLVAAPAGSALPSAAQLVTDLAAEAIGGEPAEVLAASEAVVRRARAELVDPSGAGVYAALGRDRRG